METLVLGFVRTILTTTATLSAEDLCRWQGLAVMRPHSAPMVDPPWLLAWIDAFAADSVVACARDGDGAVIGLAPMHRVREAWGGRPLTVLQSLTNVESYRFDFVSDPDRPEVDHNLWRTLCRTGGGDVIRLDHVPEDSPTLGAGLAVARELGWRAVVEPTFQTPWRPLARNVAWDHGLKRKFRANLRNRERRLDALGPVSFDVAREPEALRPALEVFYRLEASGWKGAGGTAVAQQERVKRLYEGLVRRAPETVAIPILRVSGQPVAAQVLRVSGGAMYMLKTAYDQAHAELAPGQLLTAAVLRYGIERGLVSLDFLADNASWKADWAPRLLPHRRLVLFAPSLRAQYAYWVRYGLRQGARGVPGLVPLARWLRGSRS